MQFDIPLNSQFAAITIEPISISQELPELIDLGDGRYILVRPSFEIEPFWQGQLGEIKSKNFVRTLEAIIQPDIGKTRKHFIYRGRLFVGRSSEMSELLGDIYDLRSCAEHMNDIQELYPDLSQTDIDKRAALRSFQSEVLANYAYRRICENAELRATFATDSGIREFWAKPEQEWMSLWGPAIDLEAKVKERFNPYL